MNDRNIPRDRRPDAVKILYVVNWPYHEHREMPRRAPWVKAKVDFAGAAWVKLSAHPDSADALATWEIVRGLAILSPFRGLLLSDERTPEPLTVDTIAALSRFETAKIQRGLDVLVNVLHWIAEAECETHYATLSRRLWKQVYAVTANNSAPIPRKRRGVSAPSSRRQRGVSAETPRLQDINKTETLQDTTTPPTPSSPAAPARGSQAEAKEARAVEARAEKAGRRSSPPPAADEQTAWIRKTAFEMVRQTQSISRDKAEDWIRAWVEKDGHSRKQILAAISTANVGTTVGFIQSLLQTRAEIRARSAERQRHSEGNAVKTGPSPPDPSPIGEVLTAVW